MRFLFFIFGKESTCALDCLLRNFRVDGSFSGFNSKLIKIKLFYISDVANIISELLLCRNLTISSISYSIFFIVIGRRIRSIYRIK